MSLQDIKPDRGPRFRAANLTRGNVLADAAEMANTSSSRRRGLLGRSRLAEGEGLWIVPCECVHTAWMRFPIDVLFLGRKRQILKIARALPPWRAAFCLRAHSVLELPAGAADACGAAVGDSLNLTQAP